MSQSEVTDMCFNNGNNNSCLWIILILIVVCCCCGGSMGGPYYSLTRLDEVNQRVVTIEGFVFAPATNKRNAIRALEAVAHSMRLPQDVNVIGEVTVTGEGE